MILASIIIPFIALMAIGKRTQKMTAKHYAWMALLAILQVSVALYKMFTMEKPPMF